MAAQSSHGRVPTYCGKRRVQGVSHLRRRDGVVVYYLRMRVGGRAQWIALAAANPTEAEEQAILLRGGRQRGELVAADRSVTVNTLIASFLEHQRTRLAPGTYELYDQRLRDFVVPTLGRRRVADLRTSDIRAWLNAMRSGRIRSERGILSPATQRGCLVALQSALKYAKKQGVISRSPADDLDRDDRPSPSRRREPRRLNVDQIEALIGQCGEQFRPIICTLSFTGLRVRECLGLRWSDIDFDKARIAVNGQLARDGSGWTATTKTAASKGTVPLLPRVARELRAWRSKQAERNLAFVKPSALVFTTLTGKPQSARNVLRALDNAATAAGLNSDGVARLCTHDLRGSCLSNADMAGFSWGELSKLARHASPAVTARLYVRVPEGEDGMSTKLTAAGFGS